MEKLKNCRICLAQDVRMHPIANTHLEDMYEKITVTEFMTKDIRPVQVCYICFARLRNCYQLKMNCLWSEVLFTHMMTSNMLTPEKAKEIPSTNKLEVTAVTHISMGHKEDTNSKVVKVKMEEPEVLNDVQIKKELDEDIGKLIHEEIDIKPEYVEDIELSESEGDTSLNLIKLVDQDDMETRNLPSSNYDNCVQADQDNINTSLQLTPEKAKQIPSTNKLEVTAVTHGMGHKEDTISEVVKVNMAEPAVLNNVRIKKKPDEDIGKLIHEEIDIKPEYVEDIELSESEGDTSLNLIKLVDQDDTETRNLPSSNYDICVQADQNNINTSLQLTPEKAKQIPSTNKLEVTAVTHISMGHKEDTNSKVVKVKMEEPEVLNDVQIKKELDEDIGKLIHEEIDIKPEYVEDIELSESEGDTSLNLIKLVDQDDMETRNLPSSNYDNCVQADQDNINTSLQLTPEKAKQIPSTNKLEVTAVTHGMGHKEDTISEVVKVNMAEPAVLNNVRIKKKPDEDIGKLIHEEIDIKPEYVEDIELSESEGDTSLNLIKLVDQDDTETRNLPSSNYDICVQADQNNINTSLQLTPEKAKQIPSTNKLEVTAVTHGMGHKEDTISEVVKANMAEPAVLNDVRIKKKPDKDIEINEEIDKAEDVENIILFNIEDDASLNLIKIKLRNDTKTRSVIKCTFSRLHIFKIWSSSRGNKAHKRQHVLQTALTPLYNMNLDLKPLDNKIVNLCKSFDRYCSVGGRSKSKLSLHYSEWLNVTESVELPFRETKNEFSESLNPTKRRRINIQFE